MPPMSQYSDDEHRAVLEGFPNPDKRWVMLERLAKGDSAGDESFWLHRLSALMDEMEDALTNHAWLVGDVFSLVDFSLRPKVGAWWRNDQARQSYEIAYSFQSPAA